MFFEKNLIFVCKFIFFLSCTTARAPRRTCLNPLVRSSQVVDIRYETRAQYNTNTSSIDLFVDITWGLEKPQHLELDGFIIQMKSLSSNRFVLKSMEPRNVCNLGSSHYWVNTSDSSCLKEASLCVGPSFQVSNNYRICPYNYTSGVVPCASTGDRFVKGLGYLSLPLNVRKLSFKIDFRKDYRFTIYPYYREYIGPKNSIRIDQVSDCPKKLSSSSNISLLNATEKCCDQKVPHFRARNITVKTPTFKLGLKTVNVTITWFPPITSENLRGVRMLVMPRSFYISTFPQVKRTKIPLSLEQKRNLASCDNVTHFYSATITDLEPNQTYDLTFVSEYTQDSPFCREGGCQTDFVLKVPTVDVCDDQYGICDKAAVCTPQNDTQSANLQVFCTCPEGYTGNGFNSATNHFGTGCRDKSYCLPHLNPCDQNAICIDRRAPLTGADCQCLNGFYGDGKTCSSISTVVISISFPIFIFFVLFLGAVARRYRHYHDEKTHSSTVICFKKSLTEPSFNKYSYKVDDYLPFRDILR